MKKIFALIVFLGLFSFVWGQQRYLFVDTEYILSNIPEYQLAQDALNKLSKDYQEEIDLKYAEVKELKSQMESEEVFLSPEMREKRIRTIKEKEFQVQKLQQLYFGANGELYKKRQSLIQPIQEKIYQAVEQLARKGNYGAVFDTAVKPTMVLWSQPKYDKSDKILEMLLGKGLKQEE